MVRLWLVLAAFAGLRASEIAGLRREDVRDDADLPHLLVRGKGGRERVVPLGPNPLGELLAFGLPRRGPLFRQPSGRPVTGKYVSQSCNRWLHRLGIRESIHKGRHRFATQVLDHGAHLRDLQELLGHETLAATAAYTRVLPRRAAGVVAAVDHPLTGDDR
jgi:integrase/recombinase XerD